MKPITSYTTQLNEEQALVLMGILSDSNYQPREVPYARKAVAKGKLTVVLYESLKLVVQGKETEDFVQFTLEPLVLKKAELGYEDVLDPEWNMPRIGIDESGKGDYFGPLCVAAVYVNKEVLSTWKNSEIQDSKRIKSSRKIRELSKLIRTTPGCFFERVIIGNASYNKLYQKIRNLNRLLAWGHARAVENILARDTELKPFPERIISDQFARDKALLQKSMQARARELELVQRTKAESDPAVAAASILARESFIDQIKRMGEQHNMEFPLGASARVDTAAKAFVHANGPEALGNVAKLHFSTTTKILGVGG